MNRVLKIKFKKLILLLRPIFLILVLTPVLLGSFKLFLDSQKKDTPSVKAMLTNVISIVPMPTNPEKKITLEHIIGDELSGTTGSYGIVILNLKTGEGYYLNDQKKFVTASLYKLWVMATAYNQIQNGKLKETDVLSEEADTLNKKFNIASESAEITSGKITYRVDNALQKMITISDNYAAFLLTSKVKLENVANYLDDNTFIDSKIGSNGHYPTTTALDIALFIAKLYKGDLANPEYTDKMLTLLRGQRLNNKIPKHLPGYISVMHKTGELDNVTHDAGIVETLYGDYIIVILSESKNPSQASDVIANISLAVYNYFTIP